MPLYDPSIPTHTHPIENITGFRTENPGAFNFNAQQSSGFYSIFNGSNAPISGWVNAFICRHPNGTLNHQLQLGAGMFQNSDFYIRELYELSGFTQWRKLWHDGNLAISSGNWTPTLTVNNGMTIIYSSQQGTFVKINKLCQLSFNITGQINEGSPISSNVISIASSTNSLPFLPNRYAANPLNNFSPSSKPAHKLTANQSSNLLTLYKYQVNGSNIIEQPYSWTDLTSVSLTFSIVGNITYEVV